MTTPAQSALFTPNRSDSPGLTPRHREALLLAARHRFVTGLSVASHILRDLAEWGYLEPIPPTEGRAWSVQRYRLTMRGASAIWNGVGS